MAKKVEKPILNLSEEIQKDKQERQKKCSSEIDAILLKYNCELKAEVIMNEAFGIKFIKIVIPK